MKLKTIYQNEKKKEGRKKKKKKHKITNLPTMNTSYERLKFQTRHTPKGSVYLSKKQISRDSMDASLFFP